MKDRVSGVGRRTGDFRLGIEPAEVAAVLRSLADDIEARQVMVSEIAQTAVAKEDDYSGSLLTLRYTEREGPLA